jgi:hypothetical protein
MSTIRRAGPSRPCARRPNTPECAFRRAQHGRHVHAESIGAIRGLRGRVEVVYRDEWDRLPGVDSRGLRLTGRAIFVVRGVLQPATDRNTSCARSSFARRRMIRNRSDSRGLAAVRRGELTLSPLANTNSRFEERHTRGAECNRFKTGDRRVNRRGRGREVPASLRLLLVFRAILHFCRFPATLKSPSVALGVRL